MKPSAGDDCADIDTARRRDGCTCTEDENEAGEPVRERHLPGCPLYRPEGEAA